MHANESRDNILLPNTFKHKLKTHLFTQRWTSSGAAVAFLWLWRRVITYLLTYLLSFLQLNYQYYWRDWLGRASPKWTILCRVRCKTLTSFSLIKQVGISWWCDCRERFRYSFKGLSRRRISPEKSRLISAAGHRDKYRRRDRRTDGRTDSGDGS